MQRLIEFIQTNWRWTIGLILTFFVIGLLFWNIHLTNRLLGQLEYNTSRVTGYPTKRLDEMWMKLNSMENFIRTTPLVECGDWNDRRKENKFLK